jgi:hypothetical protein
MSTLDSTLRFGLRGAAPENARALWGARWIYPDDQVWDRQDCVGEQHAREQLLAWLESHAQDRPAKRAAALHASGELRSTAANQVTLHEDEHGVVVGNPRGSGGYLYLAAWLKAPRIGQAPTRVYVYWDRPGRPPAPGEAVTLEDGRTGVVDTAKASDGAVEKRKLTVLLDAERTVTSEEVSR